MNKFLILLAFAIPVVFVSNVSVAMEKATIYGVVDKVMDGDTIRVNFDDASRLPREYLNCSKVYKTMAWVHLLGVTSPDYRHNEYCSSEAFNFIRMKVFGKRVKLEINGCGPFGGIRAFVSEGSFGKKSLHINHELISSGLANLSEDVSLFNNNQQYNAYRVAQIKAEGEELGIWGTNSCKKR